MKTTVKLPLFTPVMRNVHEETLSDKSYSLYDGYTDDEGYSVRRPGLENFADLGLGTNRPVDGLYWWTHQDCVIAVSNGSIFKITLTGITPVITNLTNDALSAGESVSFTTDGTRVYMANGGRIVYTDGTAPTAFIADADCPTTVSHLGYLDTYLLANKIGTKQFNFSAVGNGLAWDPLDFAQAVGDADLLTSLKVMNKEIYLFGPASMEIWEDDGDTPFAPIPGGFLQSGAIAKNSVVINKDTIYWLDENRHFAQYQGRALTKVSNPYEKEVQSFSTVSDCVGFKIEIVGQPFIVWSFPTADRTLVFNINKQDWAEWRWFDITTGNYQRWAGSCYCYASSWGKHLVGSRFGSNIAEMSAEFHSDGGTPIRMLRRSGHIDHGTSKEKLSHQFRIRAKRGESGTTQTPVLMLRWRDNGRYWSQERQLSLGDPGESDLVMRLHRTGIYRTRQYELSATDAVPIVFGDAEEDIEILR